MTAADPPTAQEIQRKLSVYSAAKPPSLREKNQAPSNAPIPQSFSSGNESDNELLSPDISFSPSGGGFSSVSPAITGTSVTPHSLNPIAERRDGSGGEDSEDELDEGEGGWKTSSPARSQSAIDETVIKTGYLWKKGERRKTWKKRWFVLRTAHIAYYKTAAEYQLLRLLELPDVHSCTIVALKRHDNTFGLVSAVRTFYLQAQSAGEVQDWVSAIETARQNLTGKHPSNAHPSNPIPIPSRSTQILPPPVTPSPPSFHPSHSQNATSSDSEDASPGARRTYSISSQNRPSIGTSPSLYAGGQGQSAPTSSIKDAGKTILSGYLMKCGSKRRNWKKRWFVLTGDKLFYSGSHMDTKPHRQFPMTELIDALEFTEPARSASGGHPATAPITEGLNQQSKHTFKVVTPKRTLLLCAPTEEDEIKWLGAIRALIARRTNPPPSGAAQGETSSGGIQSGTGVTPTKGRRLSSASGHPVKSTEDER